MGEYRTAEVCPNGHVSTDSTEEFPDRRERFCSKCGAPTITQCPECSANIRGHYFAEGVLTLGDYQPPSFCQNCGIPFPWTERRLAAAVELVQLGGELSDTEVSQFGDDLRDLMEDSPRVHAASLRFKQTMQRVGTSVASGVRDIIVDVLSEATKKTIWGS